MCISSDTPHCMHPVKKINFVRLCFRNCWVSPKQNSKKAVHDANKYIVPPLRSKMGKYHGEINYNSSKILKTVAVPPTSLPACVLDCNLKKCMIKTRHCTI